MGNCADCFESDEATQRRKREEQWQRTRTYFDQARARTNEDTEQLQVRAMEMRAKLQHIYQREMGFTEGRVVPDSEPFDAVRLAKVVGKAKTCHLTRETMLHLMEIEKRLVMNERLLAAITTKEHSIQRRFKQAEWADLAKEILKVSPLMKEDEIEALEQHETEFGEITDRANEVDETLTGNLHASVVDDEDMLWESLMQMSVNKSALYVRSLDSLEVPRRDGATETTATREDQPLLANSGRGDSDGGGRGARELLLV